MPGSIEFLIDLVSPFAYLAFHVLRHSPVFADVEVIYIPVVLGGILKANGSAPPISIKNKRQYLVKDRMRWARLFNVQMIEGMPHGFPWNTVQVQRTLVAALHMQPELVPEVVERLYRLAWGEGGNIGQVENYEPIFVDVFGSSGSRSIFESARHEDSKQELIKNGERAVGLGCFGLPWFIATNKHGQTDSFWGFDHIGQVADFLGLDRTRAMNDIGDGWKAVL